MGRMNVPGFSADASLYANTRTYGSARVGYSVGNQQMVPQFWKEIGDFLWGAAKATGEAVWEGVLCTAATANVAVSCTAGLAETGDVAACTDAISEWPEFCID